MSKDKEVVHEKISVTEKSMIGAIVGDIVGSRFEWHNRKSGVVGSPVEGDFETHGSYGDRPCEESYFRGPDPANRPLKGCLIFG